MITGRDRIKLIKYAALAVFLAIVCAFVTKGINETKYYKQYGNVTFETDEITGRYHTPYLTLPAGNYTVIIGYNSDADCTVDIGGVRQIMPASKDEGSESFEAYEIPLYSETDVFSISSAGEVPENFRIYEYEIKTDRKYNHDGIYTGVLLFLVFISLLAASYTGFFKKCGKEDLASGLLMTGAVLFASMPLFKDYLVYGHDLMGHLKRIEGLKDAIAEGHFIPLIFPEINNGFGEAGFAYPYFFLYIPALLRLLNVSMPLAYQTLLFLINAATACTAFFAAREITGSKKAALFSCIVYTLFPYRLTDMYVRAALGETLAMTFFPLVIAGIWHILYGEKRKYLILSAGFLGILCSHILSIGLAGLMTIFLLLSGIRALFKDKRWLNLIKSALIVLVFALPYFLMLKSMSPYLNMDAIKVVNFYRYTLYPAQFFMNGANTGTIGDFHDGIGQSMNQGVGIAGGIILLILLYKLLACRERQTGLNRFLISLTWCALVFMYLSSTLCPWDHLNRYALIDTITGMIQFPTRFLTIVSAVISVGAGIAVFDIKKGNEKSGKYEEILPGLSAAVTAVFLLIGASSLIDVYLRQDIFISDIDGGFSRICHIEYCPKDTDTEVFKDVEPHTDGARLTSYKKDGTNVTFNYDRREGRSVLLPLLYYPWYKAVDDEGNRLEVRRGDGARVEVVLNDDKSTGTVNLDYGLF